MGHLTRLGFWIETLSLGGPKQADAQYSFVLRFSPGNLGSRMSDTSENSANSKSICKLIICQVSANSHSLGLGSLVFGSQKKQLSLSIRVVLWEHLMIIFPWKRECLREILSKIYLSEGLLFFERHQIFSYPVFILNIYWNLRGGGLIQLFLDIEVSQSFPGYSWAYLKSGRFSLLY